MDTLNAKPIPELQVYPITSVEESRFSTLISDSKLKSYHKPLEIWTSKESNKSLSYLTHGIFRYFGKFPPPIARYLIKSYTNDNDLVIDPMCGSGTTALEALLLNRKSICFDINPLAIKIANAKVTHIDSDIFEKLLNEIIDKTNANKSTHGYELVGLRNAEHWFLPKTIVSLNKIREAIFQLDTSDDIKNVFFVIFLSIVRRVSRATTQQGRLFLDVVTAEEDALPIFIDKANKVKKSFMLVPKRKDIEIEVGSILSEYDNTRKAKLVICHPPYFNNYKYSGINSLELAWMNVDHSVVRKEEVREAFKVGKVEKVYQYVTDMEIVLKNIHKLLDNKGYLGLMIGDTFMKGQYIPVTKMVLDEVSHLYSVDRVALRIPQFTEASWASSQRRNGANVGINMCDFVICLKKL